MGKIIWTQKSQSHLKSIHDYIAKDSKFYADRFIHSLIESTMRLENFAMVGRKVPELIDSDLEIREIIFKNYRIVYKINSNDIEILAVIHNKRDFENAFKKDYEI